MLAIGDLVYLDTEERTGIVIKIVLETKLSPSPINVKVWWADGQISWCLGEAVTILSCGNNK